MRIHPDVPNFAWAELASPGRTLGEVVAHCCLEVGDRFWDHMVKLQALRDAWGSALTVTSAWRTPEHNEGVGGAPNSQHLVFATDIVPTFPQGKEAEARIEALALAADYQRFHGIGTYPKKGFVHLDLRGSVARWTEK